MIIILSKQGGSDLMNTFNVKIVDFLIFLFLSLSTLLPVNVYSQNNEDEIEEVVTISSRLPINLSEVVGSVNTISQEEIEARSVNAVSYTHLTLPTKA